MELGTGTYLLGNVGFNLNDHPSVTFQTGDDIIDYSPLGYTINLTFDTAQRFCIGWGNLATRERFVCPDKLAISEKFHQCPACQKRTGFNPAFYNALQVSQQQETRNQEPHFLYLAHFGPGVVKVGISYAKRGKARLLEQGARSALILDTFPSANIARQYEAKVAAMPNIAESIQLKRKQTLLTIAYETPAAAQELLHIRALIEQREKIQFTKNNVAHLDEYYFPEGTPEINEAFDCSNHTMITGKVIGLLGSFLFCRYQGELVYLPMKKFVGYKAKVSDSEGTIALPARQTSLF